MVRMTSSGTEASMSAIRLARAATGRDPILKFAGAYHGHVDGLLADAGSGLATQGIPASPGVTEAQASDTEVVPGTTARRSSAALAERPPAAILSEPYPATWASCRPADGFLEFLREAADAAGALLVFDEVISGFRVAPGGAQEREGVTPDLTVLGKVIGGGLPAAAYARPARSDGADRPGRRRLPGGHAVGQPAGGGGRPGHPAPARRRRLRAARAHHRQLAAGLSARGGRRGAGAGAGPPGSSPSSSPTAVTTTRTPRRCDMEAYAAFCRAMLERGVYPPPSQFEAWFPSLAHTAEHVERTLAAAREAFAAAVSALAELSRRPTRRCASTPWRDPGPGDWGGWPTATAPSCSRRSTRATCSTTASRGRSKGMDADLRLLAGDPCTRSGLGAWRSRATWRRWPSWPT